MPQPSVFVCYSHVDEKWRRSIARHFVALERAGLVTWWDDKNIPPGAEWQAAIDRALWEYACRAGTNTPFHFAPTITPEVVNYAPGHRNHFIGVRVVCSVWRTQTAL